MGTAILKVGPVLKEADAAGDKQATTGLQNARQMRTIKVRPFKVLVFTTDWLRSTV